MISSVRSKKAMPKNNILNKILPWIEPQNLAKKIADNYTQDSWIFLNSGLCDEIKNSRSIIALFPQNEFISDDLEELRKLTGTYFGYVAYEYGKSLEKIPPTQNSYINLPLIWLINFAVILEFDHDTKTLQAFYLKDSQLEEILNYQEKSCAKIMVQTQTIASNFTDEQYLQTIDDIKQMIARGDFYQVNLTRKFYGEFNLENQNDFFELFTRLSAASPANYSAFLKLKENYIISSSPELFIEVKNGHIISRPIKGTAPRDTDFAKDEENKNYLQTSQKEQAENLMIVDLVRNDLSRICKEGSVKVDNIFKVNSYKTLHHMSSQISAQIADDFDVIDAFKATFPPGSMTGAPKIKAMKIIAQEEKIARGVYSGAIGYFSENEANFCVVIRTLICQKNKFEFQVGGAITFDSDPQKELQETFVKAKAIMKILNLEK